MNLRYLTESYIPATILFRDKQIEEIKKAIDVYKKHGKGKNLLIRGTSGAGKTATLQYICQQYNGFIKYASGVECDNWMGIIKSLSGLNFKYGDILIKKFLEQLNQDPKALIIDEISRVVEFKHLMQKLNLIYRRTQIPIIVASNNVHFIESLENDVKLTLFFQPIEFQPYEINELREILNKRLELCEVEIPEETKNLIIGISKRENSARILLELAYYCLSNDDFDIASVHQYADKYKDADYKKIINNLGLSEKIMLRVIIDSYENKINMNSTLIKKECDMVDLKISKGRISQILNDFEYEYFLITSQRLNLGRGKGMVRNIFLEDNIYKSLKGLI